MARDKKEPENQSIYLAMANLKVVGYRPVQEKMVLEFLLGK